MPIPKHNPAEVEARLVAAIDALCVIRSVLETAVELDQLDDMTRHTPYAAALMVTYSKTQLAELTK